MISGEFSAVVLQGAMSPIVETSQYSSNLTVINSSIREVADLPASLVHQILQQARKLGVQDYALAYVLFAGGLSVGELVGLGAIASILR